MCRWVVWIDRWPASNWKSRNDPPALCTSRAARVLNVRRQNADIEQWKISVTRTGDRTARPGPPRPSSHRDPWAIEVGSLRGFPRSAKALITQKIYPGLERWPHLVAARIIKKKSCRRSWRPLVENGHEFAFGKVRCDEAGRALYEPNAFDSGTACDRH
jgi:hypothetical protein